MYTAQKLFEKICLHLISMNNQSLNKYDEPAYRGVNGRRCSVGIVISDHYYRTVMEGKSIDGLFSANLIIPQFISNNRVLLRSLQRVHDNIGSWTKNGINIKELINVGAVHNLDTEFLENRLTSNPYKDSI